MFKMSTLLAYPKFPTIGGQPQLQGVFCYIIAGYEPGHSVLVKRENGEAGILVGDWNGQPLSKDQSKSILQEANRFIEVMRLIRLSQAQFYIDQSGNLVDVQISLNKFLGPGMLRDVFSKVMPCQRIIDLAVLDEARTREISKNPEKYGNKVILKPSRYRFVDNNGIVAPMYAFILPK